ncbi:very short patch repair endonuclease [Comamonas composti]|uniref:very short patch repair endonuclease n=1 Tax=Comamonas composti TaxID=408558 RepID=UPI0006882107|nr:very short patch repair endonuclease [Comamonas composti]
MTDVVSLARRSQMMSGIKGKNSQPELLVRRLLFAAGYRFRLHRRDLPGTPDIVMPAHKVAVFVHGCFWHLHHGCRYAKIPATRPDFWQAKLEANVDRDRRATEKLRASGWRVLVVWECATRDVETVAGLQGAMGAWIESREPLGEIRATSTLRHDRFVRVPAAIVDLHSAQS